MNTITPRGLHVIMQWERFRSRAYKDGFNKDGSPILSIGFGHSNQLTSFPFDENSEWTLEFAQEVLKHDLEYFGKLVAPHIKVEIPDALYSVILSIVYNKGVRRLVESESWKILHDTSDKYHKEAFCESILRFLIEAPNKVTGVMEEKKGLRWRRIAESAIYLQDRSPDYL